MLEGIGDLEAKIWGNNNTILKMYYKIEMVFIPITFLELDLN